TDGLRFAIICGLVIAGSLIILRLICALGASAFTMFISRFITTADPNPGWKGPLIFGWAGMRGVVSLAAALSIPLTLSDGRAFPYRNLILFITFCVILITLVVQGLTLPALVKWLNIPDPDYPLSNKKQELLMRKEMSAAALGMLRDKYGKEYQENPWLLSLESRYQGDLDMLGSTDASSKGKNNVAHYKNYRRIALDLLEAQRELLQKLNKRDDLDEDIIKKFHTLLDMEEEKIRRQFEEETA
nr:cation:proton antiporter [Chitinophagaceae bacterium]